MNLLDAGRRLTGANSGFDCHVVRVGDGKAAATGDGGCRFCGS